MAFQAPLPWEFRPDGSLYDNNGNFIAQVGVGPGREDPVPGAIAAYIAIAVNTCAGFRALPLDEMPRSCRICDCIDEAPCIDDDGEACHWVGPDLCSACEKVGFKP